MGIRSDGTQIAPSFKKAEDAYTTYDEAKAGVTTFKHLNIAFVSHHENANCHRYLCVGVIILMHRCGRLMRKSGI